MGDAARVLIAFTCPRCGYRMDSASDVRGTPVTPAAGDLTVCLRCAAPLQFSAVATPAWLTYDEFNALTKEERNELGSAIIAVLTLRPGRQLVKAV